MYKMPEFCMIIARKTFPEFLGAHAPNPPCSLPTSMNPKNTHCGRGSRRAPHCDDTSFTRFVLLCATRAAAGRITMQMMQIVSRTICTKGHPFTPP